ncbi:MAG: response regulator [Chlorobi bacterium]|nr:response regulator [Chlorobiota bacterium]
MSHEVDKIIQIINEIADFNDFNAHKNAIIGLLRQVEKNESFNNFRHERALKDKNVLFSLLSKTSDDLKSANKELLTRAEELDTLLNTIPALVFFKDTSLRYVMVNKTYCRFTELKTEKIIGKTIHEVIKGYKSSFDYSEIEKNVIKTGKAIYNIEEKIIRYGDDHWLTTNLAPVKSEQGKIVGLIGVSWNITEQRNYELQLQQAKQIAEAGTKVKNQFLANISHEIRTPLNGIIGMSQILTKTNLNKNQKEYLNILINSSDSLLSLVNDILDFSKIEAGKSELEYHDFSFKELLNDIRNVIEAKAEEKGLEFGLFVSDDFPDIVNGDSYKIKQVVLNLAKNAIKFTKAGSVKIFASVNEFKNNKYSVQIRVSDTGIGIKQENLKGLFDGFYQIDATTTRTYGGTGLGLALCKKLINILEGEINVKSVFGTGSDFWIEFKVSSPKEGNLFSSDDKLNSAEQLNVLLAEDNLVNQKITEFSIKQLGYNIKIANNGLQAVEFYKDNIYDFILMDLQMPVMNGFDSTIEIRKIEGADSERQRTPIIALTANATREDRKKSFDTGMDGFMSKPFNPIELKKMLIKLKIL